MNVLGSLTYEQAFELLEQRASEHRGDWAAALDISDSWQLWDGDLQSDNYVLEGAVLVVGDIVLEGDLFIGYEDVLICIGNVECELADFRGEVLVVGNLTARSFVYANSGNDYGLGVTETLTAKLFVEEGTATFARHFDCEVWRSINQVIQTGDGQKFSKTPIEARTVGRARELLGASECMELKDRAHLSD